MATLPQPRSYSMILGDMISVFLSRFGAKGLKTGGPILSTLEAAAQSDVRDTQDLFDFLNAIDLEKATDTALDRFGASQDVARQPESASTGLVTISDTSFTKIATKIYQGAGPVLIGSTTAYIADGTKFPSTGKVYIGRGTLNLEGPLSYTAVTSIGAGAYYSLTLSSATKKFHNLSETVILAKNGDRTVSAGQVVSTPQANAQSAVSFSTTQSATILDGETSITNVPVVCQQTGVVGNVPAGAISVVTSPAFSGMAVTNPLPFSNGLARWDDQTYRDAIRAAIQSRGRGTPLAIKTGVLNLTSPDESGRIISTSYIPRTGSASTLFIDDGTGYEEKTAGIALETLIDQAQGGEQYFQLAYGRPAAKAFVKTTISAPYALTSGMVLACKVGTVRSEHVFDVSQFRDITNATSYEVVSSINSNPNITFNAHTSDSATKVSLSSRADTNEDIEVVTPSVGNDANVFLGFPAGRVDSTKLYKRDKLLYKDGLLASISTLPKSNWRGFVEGDTLKIAVDGTPTATYTFTANDFINAATGYNTVSENNSLAAWVAVINVKIPGITAVASSSGLTITSNKGLDNSSSLVIDPTSSVIGKGMFSSTLLSSTGKSSDYTLDRNLGQIKLNSPLVANDFLTVGSVNTRAYIESTDFLGGIVLSSQGNLWFIVDGAAAIIPNGVVNTANIFATTTLNSIIKRFAASNGANWFGNVLPGDWSIIWDPAWTSGPAGQFSGSWRTSNVGQDGSYFEIDTPKTFTGTSVTMTSGNSAVTGIGTAFNTQLVGGGVYSIRPTGTTTWFSISSITDATHLTLSSNFVGSTATGSVDLLISLGTGYTTAFLTNGISFVRSSAVPQKIALPAATYLPGDVATTISNSLVGAAAIQFKTSRVRVQTNTWGSTGDIALVAADVKGQLVPFTLGLSTNSNSHVAQIESSNSEVGTPGFSFTDVATVPSAGQVTLAQTVSAINGTSNSELAWVRPESTTNFVNRWGSNVGDHSTFTISGATLTLRKQLNVPVPDDVANGFVGDRIYAANTFGIGWEDALNLIVDQDQAHKKFTVNLYRKLIPNASVAYGSTIQLKDQDNPDGGGSPQSLALAFGQTFTFNDFAVYMKARAIMNKADNNRAALFRFGRYGPDGNTATVAYGKPQNPATALTLTSTPGTTLDITINLPGGVNRNIVLGAAEKLIPWRVNDTATASRVTYAEGYVISQFNRAVLNGVVIVTTAFPNADVTDHKYQVNDVVYVTSTDANFSSGFKTVTARTATTITYGPENGPVSTVAPTNSFTTWTATVPDFTTAVVNDYVNIPVTTSLPAAYQGIYKLIARTKLSFQVRTPLLTADAGTTGYSATNQANVIKFYPVDNSPSGTGATPPTVNQLVTAINALTSGIISAVVPSGGPTGTGTITQSNQDDYQDTGGTTASNTALVDGINFVSSAVYDVPSTNYLITLKNAVSGNLTAPNDYANELFRIAPQTAKNIVDYMSVGGVTGLTYGGGSVAASSRNGKITLTSLTPGSTGAIQVQGGTANSVSAKVYGSAAVGGTRGICQIKTADAHGLVGASWISCDNSIKIPKALDWTASTQLAVDNTTGRITVSVAGTAWQFAGSMSGPLTTGRWLVEKHGKFMAYVLDNDDESAPSASFANVQEGDWVTVPIAQGLFATGPTMANVRMSGAFGNTAALLNNGTVLLTGGIFGGTSTACQLYDPTTNTISTTDSAIDPLGGHTLVKMLDGRVLCCGGTGANLPEASIYNPNATTKWTSIADLNTGRDGAQGVALTNGTILVTGGVDIANAPISSVEFFTPTGGSPDLGTWTLVGNTMSFPRFGHSVTVLPNGNALIVGGGDPAGPVARDSADLYIPANQAFSSVNSGVVRAYHIAVKLTDGRVLIAGGRDVANAITSTQIFDGSTNSWSTASSLNVARQRAAGVLLQDGRVLIVGGSDTAGNAIQSCEIYDPKTDVWTYSSSLLTARYYEFAVPLTSGKVLIGGGQIDVPGTTIATTELFFPNGGLTALNSGTFRVVRVLHDTGTKRWAFWVENTAGVEERQPIAGISFYTDRSILPGDQISIGSNVLGAANVGLWTVTKNDPSNTGVFYLQGIPSSVSATALGANVSLLQAIPGIPARIIKQIEYICPNSTDPTYTDVGFHTSQALDRISAVGGTILNPLDKLGFSTTVTPGIDGYSYDTGLINEANKVVYGDETDTATYPGIAAVGAAINISGPIVKRIQVSLAIRLRSGNFDDVKDRVQTQVAGLINKAPIGQPISLSDIVTAAGAVNGVAAVTVVFPTYAANKDQIAVQSFEKPLVLDLKNDVTITQVNS